ncbi:MAG: carbon storage regulator CsrA [Vicinamibacterales bacterium]
MLVVTRKLGESIVVGDGIEIQVVSLGKNGVRIGVTAPRDIPVHRREVYDLVVAANRSAATSAASSVSALASSLRSRVSPPAAPPEALPEANDVSLRLA